MSKLSFVAVALVIAFSGAASAQSSDPRGACKADYDKFCAGIAPGGGIVACLNGKRDQLTATCKAALDSRKKK
ncbi:MULTISPECIES: cysteine rich repeat-containing protein [Bradyrhizobium]|uniref:Cysteine rich repeat-containing protein n=1 Tax=Bradyrhizobium zhanjiangense TaxID=1325107 RepID=A0A4Q0QJ84_9BRAD|nr:MULTISPECIES: cysteine rich repeat-containing protein [Bradyrhizobium]RXG85075.1 hypothetical protein EAS62_39230 [Bradyrhizobium zhanjiangense]RXG92780.1 hypothetical protein EAS61_22465 [Bradyrhizobium zhanjiangense]RXH32686.1 hypothetical protein XH94_31170 [Bradyrhizobium zhanjiangense]UQR66993.1 cysteine rich repeat-containing protein [Bradyrhizobium sp. C-145]